MLRKLINKRKNNNFTIFLRISFTKSTLVLIIEFYFLQIKLLKEFEA